MVSFCVHAEESMVVPGKGTLQAAIDLANSGDTLVLGTGVYTGSVDVNKSLRILGENSSVINGEGSAHVVIVSAPDVLISGVGIQYSGDDLDNENSGIFITHRGDRARIVNNYLENNLIGIYLKGPEMVSVSHNVIVGSQHHRMNDRGNGIYLWNAPGSIIENNTIRYGRDGIFVTTSRNNVFRNNRMSDLRFAIHYIERN